MAVSTLASAWIVVGNPFGEVLVERRRDRLIEVSATRGRYLASSQRRVGRLEQDHQAGAVDAARVLAR